MLPVPKGCYRSVLRRCYPFRRGMSMWFRPKSRSFYCWICSFADHWNQKSNSWFAWRI